MSDLIKYNEKIFENIKHIDENGCEYWEARQLQLVLEYKEWRNFKKIINKAIIACEHSEIKASERFVEFNKTIEMPNGATKKVIDYRL